MRVSGAPCGRQSRRRRCWWWHPRGSTCRRPQSRWRRRPRYPPASCCLSEPKRQRSSGARGARPQRKPRPDAPVRYNVISGSNAAPGGTAASTRWRYAAASASVRTGGFRLGITIARPNTRAVNGTTEVSEGPSRRCKCLRRAGERQHRQLCHCMQRTAGRAPVVGACDGQLRYGSCCCARRGMHGASSAQVAWPTCADGRHAGGSVRRSRRQHACCWTRSGRNTGPGRAAACETTCVNLNNKLSDCSACLQPSRR